MERWRFVSPHSRRPTTYFSLPKTHSIISQRRWTSSDSSITQDTVKNLHSSISKEAPSLPPLSVMPTKILIRSLMMTYILSSPRLVAFSIPVMNKISHSKSWFLNSDRNPILHAVIRKVFYDHFAAGENDVEIKNTIRTMKGMGFQGVILGFAKETLAEDAVRSGEASLNEQVIEEWKEGNMKTLGMLGKDDFLAVKFTGGGPDATEALTSGRPPSPLMRKAILEICEQASKQGTRIWIDAEQQVYQPTIDAWTTDLMRKYNVSDKVLIYNTFQAYLKGTPKNLAKHLKLAQEEGWTIGIKLVRGAYIAIEQRNLIHNTIEDTHTAYNSIVQGLLTRNFPGLEPGSKFPNMQFMLASHNAESVKRGYQTWRDRKEKGLPTIKMEIAQLQGMADEVSCGLVQMRQQMTKGEDIDLERVWYPRAFKCLCWGGTQECVQFLIRRVTENRGSLDRTKVWMTGLKKELWRRIKAGIRLG